MGRLSRRVRRLEQAPERLVCPVCRGGVHTSMRFEIEGLPAEPPRPCRGCGRDEPYTIRIRKAPEDQLRALRLRLAGAAGDEG